MPRRRCGAKRSDEMKRLWIVYTLNPDIEEREAVEQQRKTQEGLPRGVPVGV